MKKGLLWVIIIVVIIFVVSLMVRGDKADTNVSADSEADENSVVLQTPAPGQTDVPEMEVNSLDQSVSDAVKEFKVTSANYSFSPSTMTVKKGETVKITLVNSGGMHDLVIDEFNVRTPKITTGQEASITFVADKVGSFEYYCSVGNHRAMGMKGTLTVSE